MSDIVHVTLEQYAEIGRLLNEANDASEASRGPGLKLSDKLALQRKAKALREQAMQIGR